MFSCLVEPLPPSLRWKSVTAKKCNFYNSKRSFMFWQVPAQLRRLFFLWGIVTPFSVFLASEGSATSFSTPPNRRDSHLGKTHPKICLTVLFLVNTYSHIQSRKYDIVLTGFELVTTLGYFAKLFIVNVCTYIHGQVISIWNGRSWVRSPTKTNKETFGCSVYIYILTTFLFCRWLYKFL
jgi:hypothetical protein